MNKIVACRASGMPVRLEHIEGYQAEYRVVYDKVMDKFMPKDGKFISEELSKRISKLLDRIEKRILKRYPNTEEWDLITDYETWYEKVKRYGPITVARSSETDRLTYVILDVPV